MTDYRNDTLSQINNVLMHALEGIAMLDINGNYLSVNQSYADMMNYTIDEMIGLNWTKTVHVDDLDIANKAYDLMKKNGKSEFEVRGVKKDGTFFYKLVVIVSNIFEGIFVGHYCFMRDVTERKQYELQLLKTKQLFETFMENSPVVAFIKSNEGKYLYVNNKFNDIFGKNKNNFSDYDIFPAVIANQLRSNDKEVIRNNTSKEFIENISVNGVIEEWISYKFPIINIDGTTSVAGIRIKNPLSELEEYKDVLCNEMQKFTLTAINSFISGIAHETRSPVQAIANATELLIEKVRGSFDFEPEQELELLNIIRQSSSSVDNIISNIMNFGSIRGYSSEEDMMKAIMNDNKIINLYVLISETINVYKFSNEYKDNPIDIVYNGPKDIRAVVPNNILRQIMINLFSNALKAIVSYQGRDYATKNGKILVRLEETDNQFVIFIEDNGRGIPQESINRLFNPFFRPFRDIPGTGLGLYLSKVFASNSSMNLELEHSEAGKTIFSISINKEKIGDS